MIERRRDVGRDEFFRDYFHASRPVILEGLLESWPAYQQRLWTPDYLKERCGHEMVEVMADRDADPKFELNSDRHKINVLFSDYVDQVINQPGNDRYLVANNRFLDHGAGRALRGDVVPFPEYMNPADSDGRIFFWLGPAGTVTPLHHDTTDIFLAQVAGHKRVCMISPDQKPLLYNSIGVFSDVDYERPDLMRFPLYAGVVADDFMLNPGEVLFIPGGWWHHVRGLTPSLSISMTNFLPSQAHQPN